MKIKLHSIFFVIAIFSCNILIAQSPGGVSTGLRTWYKADAIVPVSNGTDIASWADQATADGVQNAVQNGKYLLPSYFGNRQPQYRTPVAKYNFNPFIDFTKQFSSLYAYKAHSATSDYSYNYSKGATLYQVGDLTNNQGWYLGSGLGATTLPIAGTNYEYGYPWWGLNQQYYGTACGYYYATVDDYGWYKAPYTSFEKSYNYVRPERKTQNNIPWINSISYDKYGTYNMSGPTAVDAQTAIQTRMNGDKWSWGYSYTPAGPSLFIGNELTNYNAGRWWQGGIPEVILYDRKLNVTQGNEADKVDTYLALKYGITLLHNYYISDGAKVWDTSCNNSFNNQIAGIVKDAASALNQKQSHSILKKSIVTISAGAINENGNAVNASAIADKYTMIWGTNGVGGGSRDSRTIPGGYAALPATPPVCLTSQNVTWSKKKWMVQEQTGKDVGTVKVYIESKEAGAVDWACQAYIVVGTDANFSNPVYYPLSLAAGTLNSTTDYVADINFCEGATNSSTVCGTLKSQFFAIVGKGIECSPGGVSRNLVFWVRADMGTINDSTSAKKTEAVSSVNSRVREWVNMTKGPNAFPGIAADAPTLRIPSRYDNFNPMVSFQNYHLSSGNTYPSPYENTDPDFATMRAKDVISNYGNTGLGGAGADSLSMFSASRSLADWYNASIGVGYAGQSPGLFHGTYNNNSVEYGDITGNIVATTPPNFQAPYPGTYTTALGAAGYAPSSSFGRSCQAAMFWYPRTPTTITYLANNIVDMALRGNGADLPMATQSRATNLTYYGTAAGGAYNRTDVCLAGGVVDFGCQGIQDAILYTGGFKPADSELERIETYIGIRNGITERHNYYGTDKTLLWDTTAIVDASVNAGAYTRYNKSITGIGRDDAECLHQRVSRNVEDTTVTISLGTIPQDEDQTSVDADFTSDKQYIVWGSNGGASNARITTDLPTSLPGCVDSRINREYHVKLSGSNTGNYKTQVRWQLDNNILDAVSGTSISLLIDDDGDGNYNTGVVRVIPATSYDIATNTAIFDNVSWSTAGDTNPTDAAMTIGWGQTSVSKVVLFNGTAAGGGGCNCAGASNVVPVLCTDASSWTYYKNPFPASNNKVVAINWGTNTVTANVTIDASTASAGRRKATLNTLIGSTVYDSAAILGARMLNITLTSGSITAPVKVRFYYDPNEIKTDSAWLVGSSTVNEPILSDSSWRWFKFEGTVANVLSSLTASGLVEGDGVTANTYSKLVPDEQGIEDGVKYVQFNYITNFSTIGYLQTYVKNNNLSVLPLTLLDFNANLKGSTTNLTWQTANETNVNGFDVERSTDGGRTFQKINFVVASTTRDITSSYTCNDDVSNYKGKIFYRLKIVDNGGQAKYSTIRFVNVSKIKQALEVLPNPFSTNFNAQVFSTDEENLIIRIISINGKQISSVNKKAVEGSNVFQINVPASIVDGSYILEVIHADGSVESKTILKRTVN